ncbi:MAG TPA: hypothetical protein VEZ12_13040, partial [Herpetosiphonaceae bacterium]|nr:hypothetical protein [Herpetosiphonaceae bacterium]
MDQRYVDLAAASVRQAFQDLSASDLALADTHRMDTVTQRASVQKVQLAHRRALALSLRKQGASYRAIAQTLAGTEGVSPAYNERGAWEDVTGELRRLQEQNTQTAADVQTLLMEQLKDLLAAFWQRARQGDYAACDRVLAIMGRQAKLAGVGT